MNFAIVRFVDEDDAPGIVSTNWLNPNKTACWFPNVRSEEKKNRILLAREVPKDDWLYCTIRMLKEFTNYQAARAKLSQSEDTSNLESETEWQEKEQKRNRKRKSTRLPGEYTSEEEEDSFVETPKRLLYDLYPKPPETANQMEQNAYTTPAIINLQAQSFNSMQQPETSTPRRMIRETVVPSATCSTMSPTTSYATEIKQLKDNQAAMWGVLDELLLTAKSLDTKMNSILLHVQGIQPGHQNMEDCQHIELISSLPVGISKFPSFDAKIAEDSSFRQKITRILVTTGGKDPKSLVASVMRKIMTDDVGETFSLTGKSLSKTGLIKQAFEKTEVYKLVLEVCFHIFSNTRENVVREAVSDWLMQAKFRKSRREKRKSSTPEVDMPNVHF